MRKLFSILAAVLFAGSIMADSFVPVTDVTALADGDQIIITDVEALAAISTTQNNNNRGVAEVALTDGVIVPGENVQIITLVAAEANFMLQVGEDAYLYAASNSSNHLKTAAATTVGDNGKFAISITEGVASVIAQGTNARNDLRYNPSSSCFSCYASSTSVEAGLKIFKKEGGVTPPAVATPVITGDAEFTDSVIVTITCSTEEADIYYTIDGTTDPKCDCSAAPEYKQPIVIKETTTIMAAAYTGNDWSAVATKTFTKVEPLADPTNCAEAAEAALSVSGNNVPYNNGKEYTIEGYVTSIATDWSSDYKNISFWMADAKDGGNVLQAYRAACETEADAPAVGDKVAVTGKLTKYNTTPEFAAGCTFVITEKAEPEDPREVTKVGVNVPAENKPADNQIEMAGTFKEGTMNMEKIEATGWFVSYDFVNAAEEETFKLRSKENNNLVLCQFIPANGGGEGKWVQAIFTFGNYWSDDIWKGTPCKLIELDLSDGEVYAWKEGMPEPTPELADPTNCAEAAAAALSVENNNDLYNDGKEYTIEGYVTGIKTAWSEQYKNISFWMADAADGGEVLQAFRAVCEAETDAPAVGDKVAVTGKLTKYNTTPEFAAGCTFVITEKPEPIVPGAWTEILFEEAVAAADLPADAQFEFGGLKVAITDSENKMSIDGNKAYFGTADENVLYEYRLKTGGKSQNGDKKNYITITVPEDGELRLAVRTGSNSDETRNLVLVQGEDTIYNKVVKEADAIEVAITDTTSIKVYPYVTVSVKKGEIAVGYPVNSLNFYSFAFKVAEAPAEINTCAAAAEAALSVSENNELYNNGAVYSIQGFVTAIQTAYSSQYNNITFWMADTEDGGKVLEAYRAVCESEENAPNVGDKVTVTGSLTKYNSTPEFAAGCTFVIDERAPEPENLGEKTIAEFLELKNAKDTCILTGVVDNIVNTVYGNFDLIDETDTLYVYGLLTPEGVAKQFESLGINEGDTLTIKAVYGEHQGKPQAPNAVFVSLSKKPAEIFDIEITEGVRYIDAVESEGWWQIYGENETYFITLSNSNEITEAAGTYTVAELDAEYSFIEVLETEQAIAFVDGSITLTIDDADVVTVEGTLNGSDGNIYNIRIVFVAPVPETTVEVTIDNAELDESYAESYGLYGVAGLSEDSVYVQLYIWTEDLVGEFTADDLYANYSGIIVGEEALEIYSADITITLEDGVYTVQADLLTYGNVLYKVTMIVPAGTGVENNTINVKAVKSIENGTLFIQKNGVRYNALGQIVR